TESQLELVAIRKELHQLASVTDSFNALIVVDISGKIIAAKPSNTFFNSLSEVPQARELLNARRTTAISGPFKRPNGSWMTIIAHPIFSSEGDYAGFVGGTVLLQSGSALQNTLSKLDYQEGTYFYIVDEEGTVVHHPTQDLIGTRSKDIRSVSTMLH